MAALSLPFPLASGDHGAGCSLCHEQGKNTGYRQTDLGLAALSTFNITSISWGKVSQFKGITGSSLRGYLREQGRRDIPGDVIWRFLKTTGDCWDPVGTPGLAAPRHFRGTAQPVVPDATKPLKIAHTEQFPPCLSSSWPCLQTTIPSSGGKAAEGCISPMAAVCPAQPCRCWLFQGSCAFVEPHFTKGKSFF